MKKGEDCVRVLIGTTNPAKIGWFERLLEGKGAEFLTLKDLGVDSEPEETGANPAENARIKAEYYGQFFDRVVCADSGLYFAGLPLDDPRQPGLHIRTPRGVRLNDDQMIEYYSELVRSLGGRVTAHYLDGVAVWNCGKVSTFMEPDNPVGAFYMVDRVSAKRREGWPLDSLSVRMDSKVYDLEAKGAESQGGEDASVAALKRRISEFLAEKLEL